MPDSTLTKPMKMVDLQRQHQRIAGEINEAIQEVISSAAFINGPAVKKFAHSLAQYVSANHVVPCGNGTDALQIALMALGLKPGDEVVVPTFTYVATVEVIALLGLKPVFVDVDPHTFNIDAAKAEEVVNEKTKAIVPVHLFGQCADMEALQGIAEAHNLFVVEDTAQALGAAYNFRDKSTKMAGTIGTIGTTSFFPSKNLGCFGDGGAIITEDDELAARIQAIANHGQIQKYYHEMVGVNSRLDSLQAAVLNVKLSHLDGYCEARRHAAQIYDTLLEDVQEIELPSRSHFSSHVFNQYSIKVKNNKRDALKAALKEHGIPTVIYYPVPLHLQKAYKSYGYKTGDFPIAEALSGEILSLPMHPELEDDQVEFISDRIKNFFQ